MTLLKTISGIRGTIGGKPGKNLTPIDITECTAGFAMWIKSNGDNNKVVVGRDGRISGEMVSTISIETLRSMGMDVIDLGLSTTPTVEMMVEKFNAAAGIIFTASHNPKEWNALKFLNHKGEFISAKDGKRILDYIENGDIDFSSVTHLGSYEKYSNAIQEHIDLILNLPYVNVSKINEAKIKVVVDCINSTGALSIPPLLDKLGVQYTLINEEITGDFAHNPEPLAKHLVQLSERVKDDSADLGISVDPDVDRLAFVNEDGSMFGEEYTLVAVADHILTVHPGRNTVSNLSSTRALSDVTIKHNGTYKASAVGEVNVVEMMKDQDAIIGGEGNGGIILPELHYGRDALVGIAIFLDYYATKKIKMSELRDTFPNYTIIKDKKSIEGLNVDEILTNLKKEFSSERLNDIDGLKIDFDNGWVHVRKSNTEPILRIYAESSNETAAESLIKRVSTHIK